MCCLTLTILHSKCNGSTTHRPNNDDSGVLWVYCSTDAGNTAVLFSGDEIRQGVRILAGEG